MRLDGKIPSLKIGRRVLIDPVKARAALEAQFSVANQ